MTETSPIELIDVISRPQVCELLGVTEKSVRRYEALGKLPPSVLHMSPGGYRRRYYPRAAVEQLKILLEIEKHDNRSDTQSDREFEASLADAKARDELFLREDLSIEFHFAEQKRKEEAEAKIAAEKRAVEERIEAIEENYRQKFLALERENYRIKKELSDARRSIDTVQNMVQTIGIPVLTMALTAWMQKTEKNPEDLSEIFAQLSKLGTL